MLWILVLIFGCLTPDKLTENVSAGACVDGIDNDGDGLLDCDDPDCAGASVCNVSDDTDDSLPDTDVDPDTDTDPSETDTEPGDTDPDPDTDTDTSNVAQGTCLNNCDNFAITCWCDSLCSQLGDCCIDYTLYCFHTGVPTDTDWWDSDSDWLDTDTDPEESDSPTDSPVDTTDSEPWTWHTGWTPPPDSSDIFVDSGDEEPDDTAGSETGFTPVDSAGNPIDTASDSGHTGETAN
jgi:hypothetical protein